MNKPLTEIMRFKTIDEMIGNKRVKKVCRKYMEAWMNGQDYPEKRALVFVGPPGTGKTSMAVALSRAYATEYILSNASLDRTKENIINMQNKTKSNTLFDETILFIFDEADSIDWRSISQLEKLIKSTKNPIILIYNDKKKIPKALKNDVKKLNFKHPTFQEKYLFINDLCKSRNVKIGEKVIQYMAEKQSMRQIINSIDTLHITGKSVKQESTCKAKCEHINAGTLDASNSLDILDIMWLFYNLECKDTDDYIKSLDNLQKLNSKIHFSKSSNISRIANLQFKGKLRTKPSFPLWYRTRIHKIKKRKHYHASLKTQMQDYLPVERISKKSTNIDTMIEL